MDDFAINWLRGEKTASVTAPNGSGLKNKVIKLAESDPSEVEIVRENDDGSIFAHIPVKWIKVSAPRKMSEEQKTAAKERLNAIRRTKRQIKGEAHGD